MTSTEQELTAIAGSSEAAVVADLAQGAAEPMRLEPGEVYAVAAGLGDGIRIRTTDEYAATPRRKSGARTVLDAASFNRYVHRHATPGTEVYADPRTARVIAVLDAHREDAPGWQQHRVTLELTKSPSWTAWERLNGQLLLQIDFAEFIELQASDVRDPDPATLLELAQHFEAHRSVDYESSDRLADGQVRLAYKETIAARAGQKGTIDIPQSIRLALKPYIGGPTYEVVARFRYRLHGTDLRLGYILERPQLILDAAFTDIVAIIRNGATVDGEQVTSLTDVAPIYMGQP